MKLSKCHFFSKEIQYLGHILSTKGICPLPSKTQAIQKMHSPTTPKQVCAFLGLVRYYRKIIKNFANIIKPLTLLTRQQMKFDWTLEHQEAFTKLKDSIIQEPILCYPTPSKRYIVYTDASDDACGAWLMQGHDGTEFPIAFLSHTFQIPNKSVLLLNKRPMEFMMLSPNGITISRVQTSLLGMFTNHLQSS